MEKIQDQVNRKEEANHIQKMVEIILESQTLSQIQAMKVKMKDTVKFIKEKIKKGTKIEVDHLLVTDTRMEGSQKASIEVVHRILSMREGEEKKGDIVAKERKRKISDINFFICFSFYVFTFI